MAQHHPRSPIEISAYIVARIRVDYRTECWEWTGKVNPWGYGMMGWWSPSKRRTTNRQAHRVIYERTYGPIPDGIVLDHLCSNRCCVNPDHLEAVTRGENTRRGQESRIWPPPKTVCKYGHPKKQLNEKRWICPQCAREATQRGRARKGELVGVGIGYHQKSRTHCVNGHEFTPENTYLTPTEHRRCKRCHANRERKRRDRTSIDSG